MNKGGEWVIMSPEDEAAHTTGNGTINQNFCNGSSQQNNNTSNNNNIFKLPVIKNGTSQLNGSGGEWKNFKNTLNNNDEEYKLDIREGTKWIDSTVSPPINNNGKQNGEFVAIKSV